MALTTAPARVARQLALRASPPPTPLLATTCQRCSGRRRLHSCPRLSSPSPLLQPARAQARKVVARPALDPQRWAGRRTLFIQTESTPNADALKFKPNSRVLPDGFPAPFLEYMSARATVAPPHPSRLAAQIIEMDGVSSVFYGADYITVTKDGAAQWAHLKPEIFSLISEAVTAGEPLVSTVEGRDGEAGAGQGAAAQDTLQYDEGDSEVVSMIKELLETRIRPAIQEDGGDIEFRGFEGGWVSLKLRGACRTCDSSTVTLRNGIESMLMHYIEEVKGVQQVLDQEEEVAMKEFEKFEQALKAKKGDAAIASTGGKGTLDHAA